MIVRLFFTVPTFFRGRGSTLKVTGPKVRCSKVKEVFRFPVYCGYFWRESTFKVDPESSYYGSITVFTFVSMIGMMAVSNMAI